MSNFTTDALKGGYSTPTQKAQTDPMLKNANYRVMITQDHDMNGQNKPVFVYGMVPESFGFSMVSAWQAPFGTGLSSMLGSNVGNLLAISGNRLVGQVMTMQVWQGAADSLDFNLTFELRAWSDAEADVVGPLQTLMRMALPSVTSSGFLQSPGPVLDAKGITEIAKALTSVGSQAVANGLDSYQKTTDGGFAAVGTAAETFYNTISAAGVMKKEIVEQNMKNKIHISVGRWFSMDNVVITDVQTDVKAQTPEAVSGVPTNISVTVTFRPVFAITADDVPNIFGAKLGGKTAATGGLAGAINSVIGKVQKAVGDTVSGVVDGFNSRI